MLLAYFFRCSTKCFISLYSCASAISYLTLMLSCLTSDKTVSLFFLSLFVCVKLFVKTVTSPSIISSFTLRNNFWNLCRIACRMSHSELRHLQTHYIWWFLMFHEKLLYSCFFLFIYNLFSLILVFVLLGVYLLSLYSGRENIITGAVFDSFYMIAVAGGLTTYPDVHGPSPHQKNLK